MTPTTLAAAMHRAGVGQHHNSTGSPYPYRNHDEEAEAIMAELPENEPRCQCGATKWAPIHTQTDSQSHEYAPVEQAR